MRTRNNLTDWITEYGTTYKITSIEKTTYVNNGNTAIQLYNEEEPVTTVTVNIIPLPKNYITIDTNNNGISILYWLLDNNVIKPKLIGTVTSGYCEYPVYELNDNIH